MNQRENIMEKWNIMRKYNGKKMTRESHRSNRKSKLGKKKLTINVQEPHITL